MMTNSPRLTNTTLSAPNPPPTTAETATNGPSSRHLQETTKEAMSVPLLEINDLVVAYGQVKAVKGISLEVAEGEICALLGANGAGKTTTLRAVSGLLPVRSGQIRHVGDD